MMSHGVTAARRAKDEQQNGFRVGDVMQGARESDDLYWLVVGE